MAVMLVAWLVLAVGPAQAARSTAAQLKREVEQLRFKQSQLRYTLEVVRAQRAAARRRIHDLEAKIQSERAWALGFLHTQTARIARRDATIERLETERDRALAGLPEAIRAVPLADFGRLVFTPARQAWPCDDFFAADGLWTLTLRSRAFCP